MEKINKTSLLLLMGTLALLFNHQVVGAVPEYIIIDPNGAILGTSPDKDKICREGNIYTFIGNISCDGIKVGKSDIIINGDGYTLQGAGQGSGFQFYLPNINNVKVQNTNIRDFHRGILFDGNDSNNIICRNTIADCNIGVDVWAACFKNKFYHNNFIGNSVQVDINYPSIDCNNVWDNDYPSGGNYWSDYVTTALDTNNGPNQDKPQSDGIADVNYQIDTHDIDRFPLMNPCLLSVRNIETGLAYHTIQEAIADASAGDMIHVSSGAYCEMTYYEQPYYEAVDMDKSLWLLGDGNTIIDGIRNGTDVVKITANHTQVEGVIIKNSGPFHCGLNLNGSKFNNIISNTIIDNINGIGLYNSASYNNIVDCNIASNVNVGIDVSNSDNVFVSRNTIVSNGSLGIVIQDSNYTEIIKNSLASNFGGIHIKGYSYNNEIRGNEVISNVDYSDGIVIEAIGDANTAVISNMITSSCRGIFLYNTFCNEISDNNLVTNACTGLYLWNAPNSILENNVVKSNGSSGIYVGYSDNCIITGNKISDHNHLYVNGIFMSHSNDCNIIGNKIFNNTDNILMDDASYCNITDNVLTSAQGDGLRLLVSNNNVISKNQIMDNGSCGIYVNTSEDNTIYHNIFVNNDQYNAYVADSDRYKNYWDNGYQCDVNYPTGGNFWSDYTAYEDYYHGPDQDIPGGDYDVGCTRYGIADTSHYIQGRIPDDPCNVDRYPIMLTSYKVTKPKKPEIKKPYTLTVEFTNDTSDLFEGGLAIDINGIEQVDPPNPSSVRKDRWQLDYNIEVYVLPEPCEIPIDKTPVVLSPQFTNNWNWVKPEDWKGIVFDFALGCFSIPHATTCFIRSAYERGLAVPSLTYTFRPYQSPFVSFTTDVTVDTPVEKHRSLKSSIQTQVLSIACSIAAASCSFWDPPASIAFTISAAAYSATSVMYYHLAVDPDRNYTVIAELVPVDAPNDVNELPEGSIEKRIAMTALELLALDKAYMQSYIRYDAAREDSNDNYMGQQLGAALKYNAMAIKKLQELQFLTAVLTADMPSPTDQDINDLRNDIGANGLPEIQRIILEQTVFEPNEPNKPDEADMVEVLMALTDPNDPNATMIRELCKDPANLHKYAQLILRTHYIQDYALKAMIEEENFTPFIESRYPNDVAVTDVWPSPARAFIGEQITIRVEVENHGTALATFDVVTCNNTNILGTEPVVDLAPGEKRTITFDWDTTDVNVGYYQIEAQAALQDTNDSFPADNIYTGRGVSIMQDLDGDRIPDIQDNCPDIYNPNNDDTDGDGIGDLCECFAANIDRIDPVNFEDLARLASNWLLTGPGLDGDTNRNEIVDFVDLAQIAEYWLCNCGQP